MDDKTMYPGKAFSPRTTLAANIGAGDTVIPVAEIAKLPDAPNLATIGIDEDGEVILYAAKTENALSGCVRGFEGTARAWVAGEVVARNFTAYDQQAITENLLAVIRAREQMIQVGKAALADALPPGGILFVTEEAAT